MKLIAPLLLVFASIAGRGQTTGKAETSGPCSPAVTGSGNTINIQTCGMTKEQVEEWRKSFKQILQKQIDPKVLVALLDDIKSGQIRIENGVLRIEKKVDAMQYRYQPGGTKIVTKPGLIQGEDGESAAFKKMAQMEQADDWLELLKLSEAEIQKVPDWPTPHAFRGEALAGLGRDAAAVKEFDLFIEQSNSDVQYDEMRKKVVQARDSILQRPFRRP